MIVFAAKKLPSTNENLLKVFLIISFAFAFLIVYKFFAKRTNYIISYEDFFNENKKRRKKALNILYDLYSGPLFIPVCRKIIVEYNFIEEVKQNMHLLVDDGDFYIFSKLETLQSVWVRKQNYNQYKFEKALKFSNLAFIFKIITMFLHIILIYFVSINIYMLATTLSSQNKIFLWFNVIGFFVILPIWIVFNLVYIYYKRNYFYILTYIDFFDAKDEKKHRDFDKMKKLFDRPFFVLTCKQVIKENNFVEQIKKNLALINETQVEHLLKMEVKINKTFYKK